VRADEAQRAIAEATRALGAIDVLVNSAGAARRYPPDELSAQAWHDAMDAKFFSYIHPLDIVVRRMAARGRGSVINIVGAGGKTANPVHIPGGAAVTSNWVGDRLDLGISALGQTVDASITVEEAQARVHVELSGMLAMLAGPIEAALKAKGAELLEDHSKG